MASTSTAMAHRSRVHTVGAKRRELFAHDGRFASKEGTGKQTEIYFMRNKHAGIFSLRGVRAEHVVRRPLALVAQDVPRLVHLLERVLRARRGVLIGMKLQREFPVRLFEIRLGRGLVAAEDVVVVLGAVDARDELALLRGGCVGPALGLGPGAGGGRARAARCPLPRAGSSRGRAGALHLLRQSHQVDLSRSRDGYACAGWEVSE